MRRTLLTFFALLVVASLSLAACTTDSDSSDDDAVDITDSAGSDTSTDDEPEETVTTEPADDQDSTDDAADDSAGADDTADEPTEESADEPADDSAGGQTDATSDDATNDDATSDDATNDDAASDDAATDDATADDAATDDAATDEGGDAAQEAPDAVVPGETMTFVAHDAGEVDISVEDGVLVLIEVRPNDGWEHRVDTERDNDIEVDFRQQGRELDFEAEIERGYLKIEIDSEWDDASDGVYEVGDAGEVEFSMDGSSLSLIEVRPSDGWEHRDDTEDSDEIEVDFRRDRDEADFEAEIDDGRLEVDVQVDLYFELE